MIIKGTSEVIMISMAHQKDKETIREFNWLIKARNKTKKYANPVYNMALVDDDNIVCTDSVRLHIMDNKYSLKPGLYEVLLDAKRNITPSSSLYFTPEQYPNYKAVIPDVTKYDVVCTSNGFASTTMAKIYYGISGAKRKIAFKDKYIEEAIFPMEENTIHLDVRSEDRVLPCVIRSKGKMAVIMPIEINTMDGSAKSSGKIEV